MGFGYASAFLVCFLLVLFIMAVIWVDDIVEFANLIFEVQC